jgi:hypothetical protein
VLTATLLIAATLIHLESDGRHRLWSWSAATVALPAMLSKETAIGWIGALALAGLRGQRHTSPVRRLLPAAVVTVGFVAAFVAIGPELDTARSGAYALSAAPGVLMANFSTYVHWSLAIWNPIRARSCHACSPARSR